MMSGVRKKYMALNISQEEEHYYICDLWTERTFIEKEYIIVLGYMYVYI
jgi:hypothetical protein